MRVHQHQLLYLRILCPQMWENEKEKTHKQEKGRESVSATLSLFGRRNVEEVKNIAAINEESLILARLLFISNNSYNKSNINVCTRVFKKYIMMKLWDIMDAVVQKCEMNNRLYSYHNYDVINYFYRTHMCTHYITLHWSCMKQGRSFNTCIWTE